MILKDQRDWLSPGYHAIYLIMDTLFYHWNVNNPKMHNFRHVTHQYLIVWPPLFKLTAQCIYLMFEPIFAPIKNSCWIRTVLIFTPVASLVSSFAFFLFGTPFLLNLCVYVFAITVTDIDMKSIIFVLKLFKVFFRENLVWVHTVRFSLFIFRFEARQQKVYFLKVPPVG